MNALKKFLYITVLLVFTGCFFIGIFSEAAALQSKETQKDIYSGIFPEVVALISGKPIYGSELEIEIRKEMIPIGSPKWTDLREDYRGTLVYNALNSLINSKLLYDEAQAKGIQVSDEEVQDEYLKETQQFKNEEELNEYINQLNMDTTKVIEELHKNLVITKFINQTIRNQITVTPEEMAKYYKEHPGEFQHPDIARLSEILIESDGSQESDAKAKQQAQDLMKRMNNGEDFAELARKYSASSSAGSGGDIGYSAKEVLDPEYAEIAFSIPIGDVRMIKIEQGYRILKVTDRKEEGTASLEETQDDLRNFLAEEKTKSELRKLADRLRDQSEIEFLIPAGPSLIP